MSNGNVTLIQQLYAAFGKGDLPALMNSMSPDIAWHSGGRASDYPGFGPRKGHKEVEEFFKIIAEINSTGTTVLLVEQNAQQALSRSDRAYILETGEVTRSGNARELLADDSIRAAYLGVA